MKFTFIALLLCLSLSSFAAAVKSTKAVINVARVDKVINLVDKPGIKVNVVVEDTGGSTDVSPTQNIYFTLYVKGEMYDTDATFELGRAYSVSSAKRLEGGIYEIKATLPSEDNHMPEEATL